MMFFYARCSPDDKDGPGGRKPVLYVYQSAGTRSEKKVFNPYKKIIGIKSWASIMHEGKIQ